MPITTSHIPNLTNADLRQLEVGLLREMELEEITVLEKRTNYQWPSRELRSDTIIAILVDCEGDRCPAIINVVRTKHYQLITVCLGGQIMSYGCDPGEPLGKMRIATPDNCVNFGG